MIWTEKKTTDGRAIYVLDQQQKNHFPSGILTAHFKMSDDLYPEGIIHSVSSVHSLSDLLPAKLSASVRIDTADFRFSLNV